MSFKRKIKLNPKHVTTKILNSSLSLLPLSLVSQTHHPSPSLLPYPRGIADGIPLLGRVSWQDRKSVV